MLGSFAILSASSIAETVSLLGVPSVILKGIPLSRRDWRTKNIESCAEIHTEFFVKSFGCSFEIAVHTNADITCC